jgi:crotonobetainyl-CoA:carnitine CoA-transferase CaiB-like acyl-CoA transferase
LSPAFAGLRVIDLTTSISGAYATKLLVDAGADVIKVEPNGGDPLRGWTASGQALEAGGDGALFQFLNASKRSIEIDADAPERLLALAQHADLVFDDAGPGGLARRGLEPEAVAARAPNASIVSISAWGRSGPWSDRPASEFTLQAAAGSIAYRGLAERGPVAAGGQVGEWSTGAYAAVAALVAFLESRALGHGQLVDVSMFEVTVSALTIYHDMVGQFVDGPLAQSIETPSIEPSADGWVGFATYTGQQWQDFCLMIGRPEISEDEQYFDARARADHLDFIQEAMHSWTRTQTTDEILELAQAMRIPAAPIGNGQTVFEMDHFRERGVFVDNPGGFLQPRRPYQLSDEPAPSVGAAPELDEHASDAITAWGPRTANERVASPFAGLRVVDLTAFWAGPVATATLAEFGADVVKIESIQRPDGMRFAGAVREHPMWERSPVFHGANTGKRAITLDLDSEDGKAIFWKLVEDADVVVENFSARVMDHFGFDWEILHRRNPRLSLLRMPAWGLDGPWRERVGFAANVEQVSGLAWITGYRDMPLIVRGVCDPVGGMHALVGLMSALESRRKTGEGQLVECPLAEPALNIAAEQAIEWSAYGELLTRDGNRGPAAAPQGCYRCAGEAAADRTKSPDEPWLAVAVQTDAQWQGLVRALGSPDWAASTEFATSAGRHSHHDTIDRELERWASARNSEDAAEALRAEGVPAAALRNASFLCPNPQLEQRGFYRNLEHPVMGTVRYPGFPARFSARKEPASTRPPPTLGQHNSEVLSELGIDETEQQRLRDTKVIGENFEWSG